MTQHPNLIDVYVGGRIKFRRKRLGLSLRAVAEQLGLSFQQMRKYEKGTDRIRASRLYALSDILGVPLTFFFDGLQKDRPLDTNPVVDFQVLETAQRLENIPDRRDWDAFRALTTTMNKACAPTNTSGHEE